MTSFLNLGWEARYGRPTIVKGVALKSCWEGKEGSRQPAVWLEGRTWSPLSLLSSPKCCFADGIFLSVRLWLRLILVECDPFLVWLLKATPRGTLWKHISLTTALTEQRGSHTGKSQTAASRYNDTWLLFILIRLGTALVLWDIKESRLSEESISSTGKGIRAESYNHRAKLLRQIRYILDSSCRMLLTSSSSS